MTILVIVSVYSTIAEVESEVARRRRSVALASTFVTISVDTTSSTAATMAFLNWNLAPRRH